MLKLQLVLVFTAVSAATFAAERPNQGALACVAEIERFNPKQVEPPTEEVTVSAHSSAFILGDTQGDQKVFLVTAAHNLIDCSEVRIFHELLGQDSPIPISGPRQRQLFKKVVYIDLAEDIAVFEWTDEFAKYFRYWSSFKGRAAPGKVVGELWKASEKENKELRLVPRGGTAAAAGTIDVPDGRPLHPAYSCTISRYVTGREMKPTLAPEYDFKVAPPSYNKVDVFRDSVVGRINESQFMLVESMSIRAGFSGSPIMISKDHFVDGGDIIGIVLGGENKLGIGRYAWATPSTAIDSAVRNVALANDNKGLESWDVESIVNATLYTQSRSPGKWLYVGDIAQLSAIGERFKTPYYDRFSIESRVEFKAPLGSRIPLGNKLKAQIEKLPGRSFAFNGLTFDEQALDEINLLTPYFKNCKFKGTQFYGSVFTGPTFDDCRLFDLGGREVPIREIASKRICELCAPAAIIAPSFKQTFRDASETSVLLLP